MGLGAEQVKQDCELKAFSRRAPKLKKAFPQARLVAAGDSSLACGRVLGGCLHNEWEFVLTFKEGRISHAQMDLIRARFRDVAEAKTRILVTHHPLFALPIGEGEGLTKTVGRHEGALQAVADAGVQMVLAGHYHRSFSRSARDMVEKAGRELVIQAGTATSTRLRDGETQSFNWIDVPRPGAVELRVYGWTGEAFTAGTPAGFAFEDERWATYEPQPA